MVKTTKALATSVSFNACMVETLIATMWSAALAPVEQQRSQLPQSDRYRYVVVTDMTHDDGNSLIRLLHYSNEIDIEAIVIAPQEPDFRWNSDDPWRKAEQIIDAYKKTYPNLTRHDPRFIAPSQLRSITKRGQGGLPIIWLTKGQKVQDWIGEGLNPNGQPKDSEGSRFLVDVLKKPDPRPLFVGLWGSPLIFSQALYRLSTEVPPDTLRRIMGNTHVYSIHLQDITIDFFHDLPRWQTPGPNRIADFAWTPWNRDRLHPSPAYMLVDTYQFWFYIGESKAIAADVRRIGGVGERYDNGGEGDTPAFLHLVSARLGLNDPLDPTQGSWGSRFVPGRGDGQPWPGVFSTAQVPESELRRWSPDVRASFFARLDYFIKAPGQINRPPRVVVNRDRTTRVLRIAARPDSSLTMDASGTNDPDRNFLRYKWWVYEQAGTYRGPVSIENSETARATIKVPADLGPGTIHIILEVRDDGKPSLVGYRRIILTANR